MQIFVVIVAYIRGAWLGLLVFNHVVPPAYVRLSVVLQLPVDVNLYHAKLTILVLPTLTALLGFYWLVSCCFCGFPSVYFWATFVT